MDAYREQESVSLAIASQDPQQAYEDVERSYQKNCEDYSNC